MNSGGQAIHIAILGISVVTCALVCYLAYCMYSVKQSLKSSFHEWVDILSDLEKLRSQPDVVNCATIQVIDKTNNQIILDSKQALDPTNNQLSRCFDLAKGGNLSVQATMTNCTNPQTMKLVQDLTANINKKLGRFSSFYN